MKVRDQIYFLVFHTGYASFKDRRLFLKFEIVEKFHKNLNVENFQWFIFDYKTVL